VIGTVAIAVGFVVVAALLFVASARLGMLVGVRLDRAIEARGSASESGGTETPGSAPLTAVKVAGDGRIGREENRGE
jgi:hypothetical protein